MRIVYHLGAHFTDEDRLLKCLSRNRDLLAQHDIVVPPSQRYRTLLRETAIRLKGATATVDEQALILEQIMEEERADRLILSWESFMSTSLRLEIIAEGVESEEQRLFLLERGCRAMQVFYFCRPQSPAEFAERLVARPQLPSSSTTSEQL